MVQFFKTIFNDPEDGIGWLLGFFLKWIFIGCLGITIIALTVKLFELR
jgi:hypothetical protein